MRHDGGRRLLAARGPVFQSPLPAPGGTAMAGFGRTRSAFDTLLARGQPGESRMNKIPSRAPASVAENVEKVIRVENETLRPRSRGEAITDAIGGFVGTISFIVAQLMAFAGWIVVNAGKVPQLAPFDPFPYPLLSSITSLEAVLLAAFV